MKRLKKVILLIPSAREYDRGVLRGIVEYAQIHGPWIFYEEPPSYLKPPGAAERLEHMRHWKADGIIALQTRAAELAALHLTSVMLCGVSHPPDRVHQVSPDNEAIGRMAAEYFQGLGLKHLAYCGLSGMEWSAIRGEAFRMRATDAGLPTQLYRPAAGGSGDSWFTEQTRLGTWLTRLPKPVGLLACNDDRARMVSDICRARGLRVPDDIAILGVDNDQHVCNRATPALSSVSLATERAGYDAAALLDQLISGRHPKTRVIIAKPIGVVERQSTDLVACEDANVVKAVRFIRENSSRVIQVRDVATTAGLSRRVLQNRFQKALGRTVLDEIHQSRVRHISHMLAGTDLAISTIAASIGYGADAHLARFFSRRTGISPLKYRQLHRKGAMTLT